MEINDYSYGVIPLIRENGEWKIFLINQYGRTGDVYWTFPKGHAEEGESPLQAAVRELFEESGITVNIEDGSKTYTYKYVFKYENTLIHKTVVYYLGVASSNTFRIQEDEVKEAGWFAPEEALEKLTFEPAKAMLACVLESLEE
jgi:bis(5'-nucleosidyl)-tetraphosphatase